jgi:hypothetical protein
MNLGLGNLDELKRHLLSESFVSRTDFDAAITIVGRGIAGQFDKYCNRNFERVADAKVEFTADRNHYYLPRYPLEVISSVEQRTSLAEGWVALPTNGIIQNLDETIGLIQFDGQLGHWSVRLRITYTGGNWFETLEPDAEDYPTDQPEGSTALPPDVKLAWLLQAGHVWATMDKLGTSIAQDDKAASTLSALDLIPEVKQALDSHKRYMIT